MIKFTNLIKENFHNIDIDLLAYSDETFNEVYPESGENYIDPYKDSQVHDEDLDDDELLDSEDFIRWLKNEIYSRMKTFEYEVDHLINNNKLEIWRAITSDENIEKILKNKKLGKYWSWDEHSAEAHWGNQKHKHTYVFHGIVNIEDVDWNESFIVNSSPNYYEEKETRVIKGKPIDLVGIYINNKYKLITKYTKNINFVA